MSSGKPFFESDIASFLREMKPEPRDDAAAFGRYHDDYTGEWFDVKSADTLMIPQDALVTWMKHWVKSNPGGHEYRHLHCKRYDENRLSVVSGYIRNTTKNVWDDLHVYRIDNQHYRVSLVRHRSFDGKPVTGVIAEWHKGHIRQEKAKLRPQGLADQQPESSDNRSIRRKAKLNAAHGGLLAFVRRLLNWKIPGW